MLQVITRSPVSFYADYEDKNMYPDTPRIYHFKSHEYLVSARVMLQLIRESHYVVPELTIKVNSFELSQTNTIKVREKETIERFFNAFRMNDKSLETYIISTLIVLKKMPSGSVFVVPPRKKEMDLKPTIDYKNLKKVIFQSAVQKDILAYFDRMSLQLLHSKFRVQVDIYYTSVSNYYVLIKFFNTVNNNVYYLLMEKDPRLIENVFNDNKYEVISIVREYLDYQVEFVKVVYSIPLIKRSGTYFTNKGPQLTNKAWIKKLLIHRVVRIQGVYMVFTLYKTKEGVQVYLYIPSNGKKYTFYIYPEDLVLLYDGRMNDSISSGSELKGQPFLNQRRASGFTKKKKDNPHYYNANSNEVLFVIQQCNYDYMQATKQIYEMQAARDVLRYRQVSENASDSIRNKILEDDLTRRIASRNNTVTLDTVKIKKDGDMITSKDRTLIEKGNSLLNIYQWENVLRYSDIQFNPAKRPMIKIGKFRTLLKEILFQITSEMHNKEEFNFEITLYNRQADEEDFWKLPKSDKIQRLMSLNLFIKVHFAKKNNTKNDKLTVEDALELCPELKKPCLEGGFQYVHLQKISKAIYKNFLKKNLPASNMRTLTESPPITARKQFRNLSSVPSDPPNSPPVRQYSLTSINKTVQKMNNNVLLYTNSYPILLYKGVFTDIHIMCIMLTAADQVQVYIYNTVDNSKYIHSIDKYIVHTYIPYIQYMIDKYILYSIGYRIYLYTKNILLCTYTNN